MEGVLEDNEQHLRQSGVVRVYDGKIEQSTGKNRLLGEINVSSLGQFSKRFSNRVKDLVNYIIVQGRKIENGIEKSFVRTMKLPKQDAKNLELRVVPYDGLAEHGETPDNFIRYVAEVSTSDNTDGKGVIDALILNPIIRKFNFERYPTKMIISKKSEDSTAFPISQVTAEDLKKRVLDKNDIGSWFSGKIRDVEIVDYYELPTITKNMGIILVYPSKLGSTGYTIDIDIDGYSDIGVAKLATDSKGNINIQSAQHEIGGHANGLLGHALSIDERLTHMRAGQSINDIIPRFIDIKESKIRNEDSYKHGQGQDSDGLLRLKDILARKFLDE